MQLTSIIQQPHISLLPTNSPPPIPQMHTRFRLNKKADRSRLTFPPVTTKLPFVLSNLSRIQQSVSNALHTANFTVSKLSARILDPRWIFFFSFFSFFLLRAFNESSPAVKIRRSIQTSLSWNTIFASWDNRREEDEARKGKERERKASVVGVTINLLRSRSDNWKIVDSLEGSRYQRGRWNTRWATIGGCKKRERRVN